MTEKRDDGRLTGELLVEDETLSPRPPPVRITTSPSLKAGTVEASTRPTRSMPGTNG